MPDQRELATAAALALPRFVGSTALFHAAVAERMAVTPTELHCLHLLHGGVSDSPTELARLLGMTTGAFTRLLDRMELHRLAERAPDPADRRRLVVRPLPDRMAELAELYAPMARFVGERLARWTGVSSPRWSGSSPTAPPRPNRRPPLPDVTHVITS